MKENEIQYRTSSTECSALKALKAVLMVMETKKLEHHKIDCRGSIKSVK